MLTGQANIVLDFLKTAAFGLKTFCPHILFLNETLGRPLIITRVGSGIRYLKLALQSEEFFHLESIGIFSIRGAHDPVNVAPSASLKASSVFADTGWLIEERAALTRELRGMPFGFHTEKEAQPWVIVDLHHPIDISHLIINNRCDSLEYRSLDLVVSISSDCENWSVIYNHCAVMSGVKSALVRAAKSSATESETAIEFGCDLLLAWFTNNHPKVFNLSNLQGNSSNLHKEVVKFINSEIFIEKELELTSHGLCRSFRFWTSNEKRDYVGFAAKVMKQLSYLSPFVSLGYGAILGLVRHQDLLPHDDDVDVLIAFPREQMPDFKAGISAVEEALRAAGWSVSGEFLAHRWVSGTDCGKVDVFIGVVEEEFVSFLPGPRREIRTEEVFPPNMVRLCGIYVPTPRNPFRYLARVYGDDWFRPSPGWRHAWNLDAFKDLIEPGGA